MPFCGASLSPLRRICIALVFVVGTAAAAVADWPTEAQWIPVYKNQQYLQDPSKDASGSRDVVSDPQNAAMFLWNDGTYIYFRLRLNSSPIPLGSNSGLLQAFGWGIDFDTNNNASDYEWQVMLDGISLPEVIQLRQNTVQGTAGDPSDQPEIVARSYPVAGNIVISLANTNISGDPDYFLAWRMPYGDFKASTGLTDSSPLRMFAGASPSSQTITANGGDFVGGSDLYSGFSDFTTATGQPATTGTVMFVADLAGSGDVTVIQGGANVYIKVTDMDRNISSTAVDSVWVTISSVSGDSEVLSLHETGANTGVFTGLIPSAYAFVAVGDSILEIPQPTTVTVTYLDAVDASGLINQQRTDTASTPSQTLLITKSVNPVSVSAGQSAMYTVTIQNPNPGAAYLLTVSDYLSPGFTYVSGSASGGITSNPSITGQTLTWNATKTIAPGGNLVFSFSVTATTARGIYTNTATASGGNFPVVSTGATAAIKITAPFVNLVKSADRADVSPGGEIIYKTSFYNMGDGAASNLLIIDPLPGNTEFVPGSIRIGPISSTYATATPKTDAQGDDEGWFDGANVFFMIVSVPPDDGVAGGGSDEGSVFFKAKVK